MTTLRDLIECYRPRHDEPLDESDHQTVSRVLDEARRALAAYHSGEVDITDQRDWPRYRSWAVDSYVRLRTATEPLLHALVR